LANEEFFGKWYEATGKVALSQVEFKQHSYIVDQASKKFDYRLTQMFKSSYAIISQLRRVHAVWLDSKTIINLPVTKKPVGRPNLPYNAKQITQRASILELLFLCREKSKYMRQAIMAPIKKPETLSSNEALALSSFRLAFLNSKPFVIKLPRLSLRNTRGYQ